MIPLVLFAVFLTLKLCGVIDWSWWLVNLPLLWLGAVWLFLFLIAYFAVGSTRR